MDINTFKEEDVNEKFYKKEIIQKTNLDDFFKTFDKEIRISRGKLFELFDEFLSVYNSFMKFDYEKLTGAKLLKIMKTKMTIENIKVYEKKSVNGFKISPFNNPSMKYNETMLEKIYNEFDKDMIIDINTLNQYIQNIVDIYNKTNENKIDSKILLKLIINNTNCVKRQKRISKTNKKTTEYIFTKKGDIKMDINTFKEEDVNEKFYKKENIQKTNLEKYLKTTKIKGLRQVNIICEKFNILDVSYIYEKIKLYHSFDAEKSYKTYLKNYINKINKTSKDDYAIVEDKFGDYIEYDVIIQTINDHIDKLKLEELNKMKEDYLTKVYNDAIRINKFEISKLDKFIDDKVTIFNEKFNDKMTNDELLKLLNTRTYSSHKVDANGNIVEYIFEDFNCVKELTRIFDSLF